MKETDKIIGKLMAHIQRAEISTIWDICRGSLYTKPIIEMAERIGEEYRAQNPDFVQLLEDAKSMELPPIASYSVAQHTAYHQQGIWDNLERRAQFCQQIVQRREQIRWCLSYTASRCYMKESNYKRLEEGKYNMTLDTLLDIATVIGCEVRLIPKEGWKD